MTTLVPYVIDKNGRDERAMDTLVLDRRRRHLALLGGVEDLAQSRLLAG